MAQSPEELRVQIEQTREDMSRDVDAISDKVSPSRVMHRRVESTKGKLGDIRDRVMGTAGDGGQKLSDAASSAREGVAAAPDAAISRTQGNPLAVGMLVFAAGWLASSLLPATRMEAEAAGTLTDKVKEPLKQELGDVAAQMKDELQESAKEAVESVKESSTEAAKTVSKQSKESAQVVTEQGKGAADDVRQSASQSTS